MVRLERLTAEHATAVLAFERANRAYFAGFVPDRGDAWFAEFDTRYRMLLAEQDAGICHFHVVLDAAGELVGRVNLIDAEDGSAELGYRIGEHAAGRGTATAAVAAVCRLAAEAYGLAELTAVASVDNPASRTVLGRNGFTVVGGVSVNGRPALRYRRAL
ncbi:GNAT family N-acetyltransferase [Kitasatospora paracochleata]|uniref:Ribosomal-protein-alanine N-acetyltransferase n=1 Tax=Kitasatospora paracochleata TaxID=58354 RepID=A0ABT1J5M7_9ACTN|nr:GNAT family N-acetyltransferase [Kitasatospora paracochleata]MCP2312740.1 ribosomal-protein-alanine N-acetyltransferase [Kitasatospora paracochleata]